MIKTIRVQIDVADQQIKKDLFDLQYIAKSEQAKGGTYRTMDTEVIGDNEIDIIQAASRAWWVFMAIYLVGGIITASGAILKAYISVPPAAVSFND